MSEQCQEVERLKKETPVASEEASKALLHADGAYVPLLHGEWGEVKTVVIGEVCEKVWDAKTKEWVVHSQEPYLFFPTG